MSLHTANGRQAHEPKRRMSKMKKYIVLDSRNIYRRNPNCEIIHDTDTMFVVKKKDVDGQDRVIMLNPRYFYEERIVDEQEALMLMIKGAPVQEVDDEE